MIRSFFNARSLMTLAVIFGSALSLASAQDRERDRNRPNIVLIVSDDQGYADLGCFGGEEILTPHLDRLANGGVKLTSFYVAWPACTPSRGAFLTGRYPQRNGLYDMIRNDVADYGHQINEYEYAISPEMTLGLDLEEITIADILKELGYINGVFGKWDSGRARRFLPLQRGFDVFYGFANTGIDYFTHERYGVPSMFRANEPIKEEGYATDLFRREAVKFIHKNKGEPFFLYVPFNAPHSASSLDRPGVQAKPEDIARWYPDHDPKAPRTRYMACVTNMDDAIGEILDTLDEHELTDNTLIIFFSDNGGGGPADNTPLRGRKALMFEGGVRVPAIVQWPGKVPAGTESDAFLTALEVFPTLLNAVGAEPPEGVTLDGFDMLPVLQGEHESKREAMFWERRGDKAARIGHWKWVDSDRGGGLFDLSKDIGESNDLSEEHPEMLTKLKTRFQSWKQEMEESEPRGPFRDY